MNPVLLIKIIVSIFLFNGMLRHGAKYAFLASQIISQDQLRAHFRQAWMSSFWMLLDIFGLILIWFPTLLQSDFFYNPGPTLFVAIIVSIFLATSLAQSAKSPSENAIFLRKILVGFRHEKEKDEENE